MQDILSFVPAPSPITLAHSTNEPIQAESANGTFSESFFSIILSQMTKEGKQVSQSDLTQETPTTNETNLNLTATDQKAKSVDEHLLDDLLSVVNALQQNSQTTIFPTLKPSSTLEKILGSETARQDFANVKNVSDLMDLSKKYNLGLEKLSISTETMDSIQKKFPTLAQNNFFDDLKTALTTVQSTQNGETTKAVTTNLMSLLDKQPTTTTEIPTTTPSILSELISKEVKPTSTTPTIDTTNTTNTTTTLNTPIVEEPLIVNEKQQNTLAKALQTPQEENTQATLPLETVVQKVVNDNELKKPATPIQTAEVVTQEEPAQIQVATTHVNEVKKEPLVKTVEETTDTVLKTVKSDKTISDVASSAEEVTQIQKVVKPEEKEIAKSEDTPLTVDAKTDSKVTVKQDLSTTKAVPVKESLNQFATDLKEKIEAYKPPIMKVELSLSPKSLGDVDVTLLTRGNNLHVNISSTTSTMSLFTQNQNDVKNALINMGFTNLQMNFSDQRNSDQSQQNQKQRSDNSKEFTTESSEEETASLEIVIPQYV
ncbi:flagellar hook-length control protein FliK [Sulfurospirillum diekertiae]|uniref:Flagellar hook-length control protein FliK n=1 Tax=Sulfurospirillum diekertiae TaxID=1854492 RepID=A0A290HIB4_9BACT|nr:flagellar hook-length control protein FliK [Sulfurospirillum diekertiae]ATB70971.1 flagellar hook-length control protein FliK [Sulfurospirillum diekertiae]